MEALRTIATFFPIALASGLNLYAAVLVAGITIRAGWIEKFPPQLEVLASWPVIITAAVFFLLEFFADKIHFVDDLWDLVHTFVRPAGMAFLVVAGSHEIDPALSVIAALAAGGVTLVSHTAKAGTRVSLNVMSPFENAKNIAISLVEDAAAGALVFMALKYPYLTASIALIIFVAMVVLLPMLFRWMLFNFKALFLRLKAVMKVKENSEEVPGKMMSLVGHEKPLVSLRCKSQGVPGARGRKGFLLLFPGRIVFLYSKWFGLSCGKWELEIGALKASYVRKRLLVDLLEIHYRGKKNREKTSRFVFFKDRWRLLEKAGELLDAADGRASVSAQAVTA